MCIYCIGLKGNKTNIEDLQCCRILLMQVFANANVQGKFFLQRARTLNEINNMYCLQKIILCIFMFWPMHIWLIKWYLYGIRYWAISFKYQTKRLPFVHPVLFNSATCLHDSHYMLNRAEFVIEIQIIYTSFKTWQLSLL